ncbi:YaiI/YqxD family protein [Facklamia sp. DSM 111018]|uniref:UPF0178 protein HZY91_03875 n=1 Tax=Facklamia lactis TaxID=2749967 RepID=A0ABS0LPE9_9LACT|nr:YaiI/YqxD family protein [Facklamia lactis]MBG9980227.1 YaiI/YqxD family protein [Facklamia lactis]MBG9986030.1 YaiI/YqxD family protein [Facklamia lactis]
MRILVDADACPVKNEIIELGQMFNIFVVMVTSIDHYPSTKEGDNKGIKYYYVDPGNDAVDYKIVALASPGDILVTQDYGLAVLMMDKIRVFHHSGEEYTEHNINRLLEQRHHSQIMRKAGKHTKGPSKFTKDHRQIFYKRFTLILKEIKQ